MYWIILCTNFNYEFALDITLYYLKIKNKCHQPREHIETNL